MTALELRLLGEFEVRDSSGQKLAVNARKNRALLAALALSPSCSMSREIVASLLWSDRGEAQARSSLRQAVAGLRKDLAATDSRFLAVNDARIAIDPELADIDAVEFQRLAGSSEIGALRRAAALYRGDLLADTHIKDPAFEEWLASARRRLADIASNVLEKLCAQESGTTRIDLAKRLVALDPLREASHRTLMQAYFDAGEKGLALRQYELCREALKSDLQVVPGKETEALRQALSQDSTAPVDDGLMSDDKPLVAVLPFEAISGDTQAASFCDGLTEDIITGLSRISAIKVAARSTMFTYKGLAIDIRSVGRDLGARYILEGSVRRSGQVTRVSAQLIDASSGHHIWAEQIDRTEAELFDLQDDLTRSIVASVQTQLILSEGRNSAADGGPQSTSRLLARSWQRFLGLTEGSLADCRGLAERALELDGKSGLGHRMLAIALYHQVYMGFVPWTAEAIDQLFVHARISIESDDADEYSHWAMECAHLLRMQHDLAVASLRRALEINPNCSLAYGSMGTVLAWAGEHDASVEANSLALRVNPQDPSNFFRHFGLALAHYLAARHEKALSHARVVVQARPTWWLGQIVYAASLAQMHELAEARRIVADLRADGRGASVPSLDALPLPRRGIANT